MPEEKKKQIERPLCLEMRDAKAEIVAAVNNAIQKRGLPCFILRGILEEVTASVRDVEKNEIAAAEAQYAAALREKEEKK